MRVFAFVVYLSSIVFLNGCISGNESREKLRPVGIPEYTVEGSWKLAYVTQKTAGTSSGDNLLDEAIQNTKTNEGRIISFFKDGTFTQVSGKDPYISGKWLKEGNEIRMEYGGNNYKVPFKLTTYNRFPELALTGKGEEFVYVKYAESLTNVTEDPYHSSNNLWRIKPSRLETDEQIKDRLENYLRHLAYILKSSKERNMEIISFEFSRGPVQIYNGGIGAIPFKDIPPEWKSVFYNEDNALKASRLFEKTLLSTKYSGASTGNWVEDDYKLLLAVYAKLKDAEK